jgi:hypothetical protein
MTATRSLTFAVLTAALTALASPQATAGCHQVFSNTTCSGWGPAQRCTNHFRTVCDAPVLAPVGPKPIVSNPVSPIVKPNPGAGIISSNSGSIISSNSGSIISSNSGSMRR